MTGVSKTSLLIFVVFARFIALTAKFWQVCAQQCHKETDNSLNTTTTCGCYVTGACVTRSVRNKIDTREVFDHFGFFMGHTPSTAGTFWKKFRKDSGKTPETLSERFLEFPSRVQLGSPKPYNSRHLNAPEHFQNSLPPSTAGDASLFRSGSGEGLSESVMEFPAVLGVFLIFRGSFEHES